MLSDADFRQARVEVAHARLELADQLGLANYRDKVWDLCELGKWRPEPACRRWHRRPGPPRELHASFT